MTGAGFCAAITQPGTPMTAYLGGAAVLEITRPGEFVVCTRDDGHAGSHSACDGRGHVLARWPRRDAEQYWQPEDCAGHGHG